MKERASATDADSGSPVPLLADGLSGTAGSRRLLVRCPPLPPGQSNNHRPAHWAAYYREQAQLQADTVWAIRFACRNVVPHFAAGTVQIVAIYPHSRRPLDPDNLVAAFKGPIDALTSHQSHSSHCDPLRCRTHCEPASCGQHSGVLPNDDAAHLWLCPPLVRVETARGSPMAGLYLIVCERTVLFDLAFDSEEIE